MTERIDHVAEAWEVWRDGIARGHPDARDNPAHESLLHMVNALVEQQRIANLIAAEWEKVCEDAELDTDATAAEVVDALRLQGFQNMGKDVPAPAEPEKAHYHAWSEIPCEPGKCRMEAEPSEDERYNPVYDIITDVLDEYTDMGVRHEVAVEIIDRVRIAGAWPAETSEDEREVCDLCGGYNYVCFTKDTKCPKCNGR